MKYFFTAAIASSEPGQAHSAEAVRQRIRQMIDDENPDEVLSDDVIVERLRKADILVARRTVAKYRDSLKIPSSVERRKMKMAPMRARFERDNSLAVEPKIDFSCNINGLPRRLTRTVDAPNPTCDPDGAGPTEAERNRGGGNAWVAASDERRSKSPARLKGKASVR